MAHFFDSGLRELPSPATRRQYSASSTESAVPCAEQQTLISHGDPLRRQALPVRLLAHKFQSTAWTF